MISTAEVGQGTREERGWAEGLEPDVTEFLWRFLAPTYDPSILLFPYLVM